MSSHASSASYASFASTPYSMMVPNVFDLPWTKSEDFGIGTTVTVNMGRLTWFGPACTICGKGHPGVRPQDCRVNVHLLDYGQLGAPNHRLEF